MHLSTIAWVTAIVLLLGYPVAIYLSIRYRRKAETFLLSPERPLAPLLLSAYTGLLLVIGFFIIYKVAKAILGVPANGEPPWALITALAAVPSALLGLYWRNLSGQRQIDDQRFHNAAELLSSEDLHARIAGVYTLERLAKENTVQADVVIEVLCAFVRACDPAQAGLSADRRDFDTKLSMDMISRLWHRYGSVWNFKEKLSPDLSGTRLNGLSLWGARLQRFYLRGAHLGDCNLQRAELSGADLTNVDFKGTKLHGARLAGAVGVTSQQIAEAEGNMATILPKDVEKPSSWGYCRLDPSCCKCEYKDMCPCH
jgi:hypothetical protein